MKEIRNHCTHDQSVRLNAAIRAAGLEWPNIDWAFYTSKGKNLIWRKDEKEDFRQGWGDISSKWFIPCPTLAELLAMTYWYRLPFPYSDPIAWFVDFFEKELQLPEGIRNHRAHWAKMQEENQ